MVRFSVLIFHMINSSQIYITFNLKDPNSENKVAQNELNVNMMLNLDKARERDNKPHVDNQQKYGASSRDT